MTENARPVVGLAALQESSNPAEVGHCAVCLRELIRTVEDCWHPARVTEGGPPCPPEFTGSVVYGPMWGLGPNRPGRVHWRPGPPPPAIVAPAAPKVERATFEVKLSDGTLSRFTYIPEEGGTLDLDVTVSVDRRDDEANRLHPYVLPRWLPRSVHEIVIKDAANWTHERGVELSDRPGEDDVDQGEGGDGDT